MKVRLEMLAAFWVLVVPYYACAMDLSDVDRNLLLTHGYSAREVKLFDLTRVAPAQAAFEKWNYCLRLYSATSRSVIVANEYCSRERENAVAVIAKSSSLPAADKIVKMAIDIIKIPQDAINKINPTSTRWNINKLTSKKCGAILPENSGRHTMVVTGSNGGSGNYIEEHAVIFSFEKDPPVQPREPNDGAGIYRLKMTFRRQGVEEFSGNVPFRHDGKSWFFVLNKKTEVFMAYASIEFENGEYFVLNGNDNFIAELDNCQRALN